MPTMLIMIVVLGGMWFFMTRSQKKQQQERQNLLDSMKPGDGAVTIGGLHGIIHEVNQDQKTVIIDCEGVYLEFDRTAIRTVTPGAGAVIVDETPAADAEVTEVTEVEEPIDVEEPVEETKE